LAFGGCTALTSINFAGTVEQWKAIEFEDEWDKDTGEYTVYCIDGTVTKN
jgi:hypothetical protein